MIKQEEIDKLQNAIAALDNQISQVHNALNSPNTTADQVLALRSAMIQMEAQRSALLSALIDLQASAIESDAMAAAAAPKKEVESVHEDLKASITDRTIVDATLKQATAVTDNVARLQVLLAAPKTKKARKKAKR